MPKSNQGACFMKHVYIGASTLKNTKDAHEHKTRQMHLQIRFHITEQKTLPLAHGHWPIKRDVYNLSLLSSRQMALFCKTHCITRSYVNIAMSAR